MTQEKHAFQAEVSQVLDIVVNALYSHSEIFLRELISNASDACDKLRYAALTHPDLMKEHGSFEIKLIPNKSEKTLSVIDNGIGMNKEELIEDLGTIAKSGSAEFAKHLTGDAKKDLALHVKQETKQVGYGAAQAKVNLRLKKNPKLLLEQKLLYISKKILWNTPILCG